MEEAITRAMTWITDEATEEAMEWAIEEAIMEAMTGQDDCDHRLNIGKYGEVKHGVKRGQGGQEKNYYGMIKMEYKKVLRE